MKLSQLFSQTLRDAPAEAEVASHQLLMRAGYIRPLAAGIFCYLPLARRALNKIEAILREEMNAIGGQEVTMPVVQPADLWKETGRWQSVGAEMGRFQDRTGRDMALAMTHEEAVSALVRSEIRSYRQLPALIYHIQTKFRDDPRPRAGLIRVREFTMKDSYSLDTDWEGLDRQYRAHYQAYFNIFNRCGLPVIAVELDTGMMGGKLAHEFMYLTPIGEDTLLLCDCNYSANRQIANFRKPAAVPEDMLPVEKIPTPETKTIEDLANLLHIPKARTAKAVFMIATPMQADLPTQFVFAIVRGDMEVNETKLANAVQAATAVPISELRPAREEEIRAIGAEPGYASPVGLKAPASGLCIIVDDAIPNSPNLVAGANAAGYHLRNVNYGRDYSANGVADIAAAQDGDACPECGAPLRSVRGVETGNIFKLGTRYSLALGCTFVDQDQTEKPVIMGSYGIGTGRLLACIAEQHHDEYGLIWPVTVAPFQVHLVALGGKKQAAAGGKKQAAAGGEKQADAVAADDDIMAQAERLYTDLQTQGIDVLFDDRELSPGVKFNDADLMGMPLRITVSERAFKQGGVEFKRRDRPEKTILPRETVIAQVKAEIATLQAEIAARVIEVPYREIRVIRG